MSRSGAGPDAGRTPLTAGAMAALPFPRHPRLFLAVVFLLLSVVGLHSVALDPSRNEPIKFKPLPELPLMWQDNRDAYANFWSVVYFPEFYHRVRTRIERPGQIGPTHGIGLIWYQILQPLPLWENQLGGMAAPKKLILAMVLAEATVHMLLAAATMAAAFILFRAWMPPPFAALGVGLMMLHPFMFYSMGIFHQTILQFSSAVFMTLFLFLLIPQRTTPPVWWRDLTLYGVLTGWLTLAKMTLAPLGTVLCVALYYKRWREVIWILLLIAGMFGLYRVYLHLDGLEWYSTGMNAENAQGVWLVEALLTPSTWPGLLAALPLELARFVKAVVIFQGYWLIPAVLGARLLWRTPEGRGAAGFMVLAVVWNFVQGYASRRHHMPYMSADFWFLTCGATAYWCHRRHAAGRLPPTWLYAGLAIGIALWNAQWVFF
ncbi:MAG: hypothetical protein HQL82_12895 [Magnetococcales bacterium]|nr:hypothetical protein [Magnetococcales bacterium]